MTVVRRHRRLWARSEYRRAVGRAVALFAASLIFHLFAGIYATERASNSVTDIILSNTPVFDVDAIFVYGTTALIAWISLLLLWQPRRNPFVLESLCVFIIVRSLFISLTHIGPFPQAVAFDIGSFTRTLLFGGGLFFSGHTGIPFLLGLLFWGDHWLRYVFLSWSALFAIVVLLGHYHYSIDVLSAYFITFTVYHIALRSFAEDPKLFLSASEPATA